MARCLAPGPRPSGQSGRGYRRTLRTRRDPREHQRICSENPPRGTGPRAWHRGRTETAGIGFTWTRRVGRVLAVEVGEGFLEVLPVLRVGERDTKLPRPRQVVA